MDRRLSRKLCEDFPELLACRQSDDDRMPFRMFGFETDSGWFPVIYRTLQQLSNIQKRTGEKIIINQIKEKFGTLRIYVVGSDSVQTVAEQAMEQSVHVCEVCGRPGTLRTDGWFKVRCDDHVINGRYDLEHFILEMLEAVDSPAGPAPSE